MRKILLKEQFTVDRNSRYANDLKINSNNKNIQTVTGKISNYNSYRTCVFGRVNVAIFFVQATELQMQTLHC